MTTLINRLSKAAIFTDIHFGRKNNSHIHNQDCLDFIKWFCDNAKKHQADHIVFCGDWYEHRSAIAGSTMKASYDGMKMLNDLDIPVFIIIGNHDLSMRYSREVFTTYPLEALDHIWLINEPVYLEDLNGGTLFCPFIFESEYKSLLPLINKAAIVYGHFEFKGFVVTGDTRVLEHGPDHTDFGKPDKIITGHFHKRQNKNNVYYIGNAFPADFSDANDSERGMCIYDYGKEDLLFIDWEDCPKYVKADLSKALESPDEYFLKKARVDCLVDIPLEYQEAIDLKQKLMEKYDLRELTLTENQELSEALKNTQYELEGMEQDSTSEIVASLLGKIESEKLDNNKLIKIYRELPIED